MNVFLDRGIELVDVAKRRFSFCTTLRGEVGGVGKLPTNLPLIEHSV